MTNQMYPVNSSQISYIGYEGTDLYIKFKNGTVYKYANVPKDLFDNLKNSKSVGKYFTDHIKNSYDCTKI